MNDNILIKNDVGKLSTFETMVYETKSILDRIINNELKLSYDLYTKIYSNVNQIKSFFYNREVSKNENVDVLDSKFLETINSIAFMLPTQTIYDVGESLSLIGYVYREQYKSIRLLTNGTARVTLPRLEQDYSAGIMKQLLPMKKIGDEPKTSLLYYYDFSKGIYDNNDRTLNYLLSQLDGKMTINGRKEVIALLDQDLTIPFSEPTKSKYLVVLGNGILDLTTKQLLPFSPEYVFITKADVNWNPNAQHPTFEDGWNFEDFLNLQAKGDDDVKMFWQTIQYTLMGNMPKNVFVFLYDALGNTGKGTFSTLLSNLIGKTNVGIANINALSDRFGLEHVYNKSLIYGDENDNVYVTVNNNMKTMATGDPVSVEGKGLKSFMVAVTPMILQSMNSTPVFRNMDGGIKRRLRMIEFTHSYTGSVNYKVKSEYICNQELLEWIAYTALTMPVEEFVDSVNSKSIKGEMESESNPVHAFLEEVLPELESTKIPTNLLFTYFRIWLKHQNKKTDWTAVRFMKDVRFETVNFGWTCSDNKQRLHSFVDPSDYNRIYESYLNLGGSSNGIPILLPYDNESTQKMLKLNSRYIEKRTD